MFVVWPVLYALIGATLCKYLWHLTRYIAITVLFIGYGLSIWVLASYDLKLLTVIIVTAIGVGIGFVMDIEKIIYGSQKKRIPYK